MLHHHLEYIKDHRLNLSLLNSSNIDVNFNNKLFKQGIPHKGHLKNQVLTHPQLFDMEHTCLLIKLGTDMDMAYPPISELGFLLENPPINITSTEMPQADLTEATLSSPLTVMTEPATSMTHMETSTGLLMKLGEESSTMLSAPFSHTSATS